MLTVVPPEEQLIVLRFYAEKRVVLRRRLPNLNDRPAMAACVDLGCFDALPVDFIDPCGRESVASRDEVNVPKIRRYAHVVAERRPFRQLRMRRVNDCGVDRSGAGTIPDVCQDE